MLRPAAMPLHVASFSALLACALIVIVTPSAGQDFPGYGDIGLPRPPPSPSTRAKSTPLDPGLLALLQLACRTQEGSDVCPADANYCEATGQCAVGQHCLCVRGCHQMLCQNSQENAGCARHPIPVHGHVVDRHNVVEFHCGDAHKLLGPREKTCVDGLWRPLTTFAKCKVLKCDMAPAAPVNGFVEFSPPGRTRRSGTRAVFSCEAGYSLHGNADIRCLKVDNEAAWSGAAAECRRDGGWGEWDEWQPCSVSCQHASEITAGVQQRGRTCSNPAPEIGGKKCAGESVEMRPCQPESICEPILSEGVPGDAPRVMWDAWSNCSRECGAGLSVRYRNCSLEEEFGLECDWNETEAMPCFEAACPVAGGWSNWTAWGECSVLCGVGTFNRSRSCDSPLAMHGGVPCAGPDVDTAQCFDVPCPVDGGWSEWENISTCSQTCGTSLLVQRRDCTNPTPAHEGRYCRGAHQNVELCQKDACPVDGGWSDWLELSTSCSVTCGNGSQLMFRTCTSPVPSNGGLACQGNQVWARHCGTNTQCPVHGGWSEWYERAPCSVTCGRGFTQEQRNCTSPAPDFGGDGCRGEQSRLQMCSSERLCPVDGRWTTWKPWSECSVSCGRGEQERTRDCLAPQHSGKECVGDSRQVRACNVQHCPIHGNWSSWREWQECSVECGSGVHLRQRTCDSPAPRYGGFPCSGSTEEVEVCNDQPCPVDGGWSDWQEWQDCSVSCGTGGMQTQRRLCNNPYPQNGGQACDGSDVQTRSCPNTIPCPVHGGWTEWDEWSACSETCGLQGYQLRHRTCTNPRPQHDGRQCAGSSQNVGPCRKSHCPVNGYWHRWGGWSACDAMCEKGLRTRTRTCQPPQHGGQPCAGGMRDIAICQSSVTCPNEVHLGCFSSQPTTSAVMRLTYEHPLLRTAKRCLHRCRQHLRNYAVTRSNQDCFCANAYSVGSASQCTRHNYHVYKGLTGKSCTRRLLKIEPYAVTVSVSVQQRFTTKCGFAWWRRCTRYRSQTHYRRETRYKQAYHIVPC